MIIWGKKHMQSVLHSAEHVQAVSKVSSHGYHDHTSMHCYTSYPKTLASQFPLLDCEQLQSSGPVLFISVSPGLSSRPG